MGKGEKKKEKKKKRVKNQVGLKMSAKENALKRGHFLSVAEKAGFEPAVGD